MKSKDTTSRIITTAVLTFMVAGLLWWYLAGMPTPDQLK